jgi:hypothetical protein
LFEDGGVVAAKRFAELDVGEPEFEGLEWDEELLGLVLSLEVFFVDFHGNELLEDFLETFAERIVEGFNVMAGCQLQFVLLLIFHYNNK